MSRWGVYLRQNEDRLYSVAVGGCHYLEQGQYAESHKGCCRPRCFLGIKVSLYVSLRGGVTHGMARHDYWAYVERRDPER